MPPPNKLLTYWCLSINHLKRKIWVLTCMERCMVSVWIVCLSSTRVSCCFRASISDDFWITSTSKLYVTYNNHASVKYKNLNKKITSKLTKCIIAFKYFNQKTSKRFSRVRVRYLLYMRKHRELERVKGKLSNKLLRTHLSRSSFSLTSNESLSFIYSEWKWK